MARIPEIPKEKYDIEMEFQIHPMSTIGTDVSRLEAVQTGFIDMTSDATAQFSVFSTEQEAMKNQSALVAPLCTLMLDKSRTMMSPCVPR